MAKAVKEKKENKRHFFKDFKAELKKVIWPTPKQVANNTTAVVTIVLLTAIIVFVLDLAFEKLNTHGVDKLRSIVSNNENTVSSHEGHTHENETNSVTNSINENNNVTE